MENKTWTLTVEEDTETGDALLTFPLDLLEATGWTEGDTIVWNIHADGKSYVLNKKKDPLGS